MLNSEQQARQRAEQRRQRERQRRAEDEAMRQAARGEVPPEKPVVKVVKPGPGVGGGAGQVDVGRLTSGVETTVTTARLASSRTTGTTRHRGEPNLQLLAELRDPKAIRKAIIIGEMMSKPVAMRDEKKPI